MTDNQNNRRKNKGVTTAVVIGILGAIISKAGSCDCSNDFLSERSTTTNDRPLANFNYDIDLDDYDFSIFNDDYEFEYEFEEELLCLRVKQAGLDSSSGILTAVIENYGNASEDGLPALIMKESKDAEDYICCVYPDSYYEEASEKLYTYIDYRTLILPQTEVTLSYQVQSYELEYLQEAIAESGEIWVTFYKDTLEETYCLLEIE